MASPLPEPFTLVDILGDGEILTCKAELRGEEVLVHVLPADPAARDRVFARISRLPRNPHFLDRIEHQGHSLVVTTCLPQLEDFEGWLDEMAPEADAGPEPEEPRGEATRLVLNIRAHVQEQDEDAPGPGASGEKKGSGDADEGSGRRRPEPVDPPTPAISAGFMGVPEAWSSADEDDAETGEHAALPTPPPTEGSSPAGPRAAPDPPDPDEPVTMEPGPPPSTPRVAGDDAATRPAAPAPDLSEADAPTREPAPAPELPDERGRPPSPGAGDAPTREPGPAPELPDEPSPRPTPPGRPASPDAPTREPRPRPADPSVPSRTPDPAPAPDAPAGGGQTRRKTQLFLSMVPPGGQEPKPGPPPPPRDEPTGASPRPAPPSGAPAPSSRDRTAARRRPSAPPPPWYARFEPLHLAAAAVSAVALLVVLWVIFS